MKVLIIEDENQTAKRLENLVLRYDPSTLLLGIFPSVKKTLDYFHSPGFTKPDLIFLDIHLEDDLGFKILEQLDSTIPVIFTTAHSEYTLKAFKNFTIDYLLKPIDFEELCVALDKYRKIGMPAAIQNQASLQIPSPLVSEPVFKERYMVSIGPKIQSIAAGQIAYFSYEQKASFITTKDNKHYPIDYSLDKIMQNVDPREFFRINRSVIASFSSIASITSYSAGKLKVDLQPTPTTDVFVSSDRISAFKEWLGK